MDNDKLTVDLLVCDLEDVLVGEVMRPSKRRDFMEQLYEAVGQAYALGKAGKELPELRCQCWEESD